MTLESLMTTLSQSISLRIVSRIPPSATPRALVCFLSHEAHTVSQRGRVFSRAQTGRFHSACRGYATHSEILPHCAQTLFTGRTWREEWERVIESAEDVPSTSNSADMEIYAAAVRLGGPCTLTYGRLPLIQCFFVLVGMEAHLSSSQEVYLIALLTR